MLKWADDGTGAAIRLLAETVRANPKRLVLWVGAGASSWCGYLRWNQLADHFHSAFIKFVSTYDRHHAGDLLQRGLPDFFGYCQSTDRTQYFRLLAEELALRPPTAIYERFIRSVADLDCIRIVTTNIDEALEHSLGQVNTIQKLILNES